MFVFISRRLMTLQLNGQRLCQQNIILLNLFPMKGSCKPPQEDSGKYFPDESFLQATCNSQWAFTSSAHLSGKA